MANGDAKRGSSLAAVAVGGAVGAAARWIVLAQFDPAAKSSVTFCINVAGSLLLGFVLGLTPSPTAPGRSPRPAPGPATLLVGTGFAGGFTTFSSFTVDAAARLADGDLISVGALLIGTGLNTVLAAGIGYRVGRFHAARRFRRLAARRKRRRR